MDAGLIRVYVCADHSHGDHVSGNVTGYGPAQPASVKNDAQVIFNELK
jgi:hypothetical protein